MQRASVQQKHVPKQFCHMLLQLVALWVVFGFLRLAIWAANWTAPAIDPNAIAGAKQPKNM
eukprot:6081003-Amphidinium_carterae.1